MCVCVRSYIGVYAIWPGVPCRRIKCCVCLCVCLCVCVVVCIVFLDLGVTETTVDQEAEADTNKTNNVAAGEGLGVITHQHPGDCFDVRVGLFLTSFFCVSCAFLCFCFLFCFLFLFNVVNLAVRYLTLKARLVRGRASALATTSKTTYIHT